MSRLRVLEPGEDVASAEMCLWCLFPAAHQPNSRVNGANMQYVRAIFSSAGAMRANSTSLLGPLGFPGQGGFERVGNKWCLEDVQLEGSGDTSARFGATQGPGKVWIFGLGAVNFACVGKDNDGAEYPVESLVRGLTVSSI